MNRCKLICEIECVSCDPGISPGPVKDGEYLYRGAYDPMHVKNSRITNGVVQKAALLRGELSTWRETANVSLSDIKIILSKLSPPNNSLWAILGPNSDDIRAICFPGTSGRALCVRDECLSDRDGGKHEAHVHIALCDQSFPEPRDQQSEYFVQVFRDLVTLFQSRMVWSSFGKEDDTIR
jgi:hypothetical protein